MTRSSPVVAASDVQASGRMDAAFHAAMRRTQAVRERLAHAWPEAEHPAVARELAACFSAADLACALRPLRSGQGGRGAKAMDRAIDAYPSLALALLVQHFSLAMNHQARQWRLAQQGMLQTQRLANRLGALVGPLAWFQMGGPGEVAEPGEETRVPAVARRNRPGR